MANRACPKCTGAMYPGFIPDYSYGAVLAGAWYEGVPEKGLLGSIKMKGKQPYMITTYRCSACGFLENYAHPTK